MRDPANCSQQGHILKGVGGLYHVDSTEGELLLARPLGIFRKKRLRPLPGDVVGLEPSGDDTAPWSIVAMAERKNVFIRPPLANLDLLVIVMALEQPRPDLLWLDKMLIVAASQQVEPILCFTKADLSPEAHALGEELCAQYGTAGFPCFLGGKDCDLRFLEENLIPLFQGKNVAFSGLSGVGKSTLLNRLSGDRLMETASVSEKLGRGRHTTRHVEFFPLRGAYVADTPGFSSLLLEELPLQEEDVILAYPEMQALEGTCRFQGCRHMKEPGCAVKAALGQQVHQDRWERYCQFRQHLYEERRKNV